MVCLVISDLYSFYLIILLNPAFDCSNNLVSFSVDIVINGTYNSVILNVKFVGLLIAGLSPSAAFVALLVNTQFADQVKVKDTSQLISGI